jgi:hypothetical protein
LVSELVTTLEQGRLELEEWNVERGECCQENEVEEYAGKMKKMA